MRLVVDRETAAWLEEIEAGSKDMEWDRGNKAKLPKHGLTLEDVESVFASPVVFAGRIVEPKHDEPRWLLLGRSVRNRRVALIFTRRGNRLRPISCRPMRRNERRVYEEAIEAIKEEG